nr:reverse transcriptase domain-containing protein [Tanacetum cinerariifolium]
MHVNGAPECMRFSRFMHGIANHGLNKRLNGNIPKSVDKMMSVTTAFLWGEVHTSHKTPKGILAIETVKFKAPPPMIGPAENQNKNKFSEFHGDKGDGEHSINAMMNFMIVKSPSSYNGIIDRPYDGRPKIHSGAPYKYPRRMPAHQAKKRRTGSGPKQGHPRRSFQASRSSNYEGCSLPQLDLKPSHGKEARWQLADVHAYKGYHQIQMAEEDEEKTAFHMSQGVFCYTKMPFGLKNAGTTYQRLMDKSFKRQKGHNLEKKKYIKDHMEIHHIKQRDGELTEAFMECGRDDERNDSLPLRRGSRSKSISKEGSTNVETP